MPPISSHSRISRTGQNGPALHDRYGLPLAFRSVLLRGIVMRTPSSQISKSCHHCAVAGGPSPYRQASRSPCAWRSLLSPPHPDFHCLAGLDPAPTDVAIKGSG
jgi:hypothetical protein